MHIEGCARDRLAVNTFLGARVTWFVESLRMKTRLVKRQRPRHSLGSEMKTDAKSE